MTYSEFLTKLQETPRNWIVTPQNWIRTASKTGQTGMCPLAAIFGGPNYNGPYNAKMAGLIDPWPWHIMAAADNNKNFGERLEIRRDLLEACGLTE